MPVKGDAQWNALMSSVEAEADAELQGGAAKVAQDRAAGGIVSQVGGAIKDVRDAAFDGAAASVFETKDFVSGLVGGGEPKQEDKSLFRQGIERDRKELNARSGWNGAVSSVAQFATGFLGVGKVAPFLKGGLIKDAARAATVGSVMFDPEEERLSNFVQSFPALQNPLTAFLAAKPEDSRAEGRLKNAAESLLMDGVAAGAVAIAARVLKLSRAGDHAGADAARQELEAANEKLAKQEADHYERKSFVDEAFTDQAAHDLLDKGAMAQEPQGGLGKNFIGEEVPKVHPGLSPPPEGMQPMSGRAAALDKEMRQEGDTLGDEFPGGGDDAGRAVDVQDTNAKPFGGGGMAEALDREMRAQEGARGEFAGAGQENGPSVGAAGDSVSGGAPSEAIPGGSSSAANGPDVGSVRPASGPSGGSPTGVVEHIEQIPAADAKGMRREGPKPPAPITPEQVQQSIKRAAKDDEAIEAAGSVEAALQDGHKFSGGDNIPFQILHAPGAVKDFISEQVNAAVDIVIARKGGNEQGILKDAKVDRMVTQMGKLFEVDPKLIMGELRRAGDDARPMAAQMETAFRLANSAFIENYEMVRRIQAGNLMGYETREEALEALRQRTMIAMEFYANGKSLLSNAARTLRRSRQEFRSRADQMTQVNLAKMDPEDLYKMMLVTDGDTRTMARMANPSILDQLTDGVIMFRTANILSGPTTHVINAASNFAMMAFRPITTIAGSHLQEGFAAMTKNDVMAASAVSTRRAARVELISTVATINDGLSAFKKAWLMGDSIIAPHNSAEAFEALSGGVGGEINHLPFKEMSTIDDVIANGLRAAAYIGTANLRLMGSVDEMVKVMRYRGVLMGRAANEAETMGLKEGSQAYKDYLRQRADSGFDEAGRAIDADALKEARITTFQQDLKLNPEDTWIANGNTLGSAAQAFTSNFSPAKIIIPFIKTPSNLFRYGIKLTPGLNLLQKEYLNSLRGAHGEMAQATAMGEMAMGITLLSAGVTLRMQDMITGSGPSDVKQAKEWKAEGNMPYALKQGGGMFQVNRMDPFQFPLAAAADFVDMHITAMNAGDGKKGMMEQLENVAASLVLAVAHQVRDKTYYKGAADFMDAINDDRKAASWTTRFAPGFIPGVSMLRTLNNDPYLREANGMVDALKASIPGYSDTLPARYNALGEKVKVPGRFYNEKDADSPLTKALDQQYAMTGTYLTAPPSTVDGIDLKDITLQASGKNAFEAFNELVSKPKGMRQDLKTALTKTVESKNYEAAPHGESSTPNTKEYMVAHVISSYRTAARQQLTAENHDLRDALGKKARDSFNAAMGGKKDLRSVAAAEQSKSLNKLLTSSGFSSLPTVQPIGAE